MAGIAVVRERAEHEGKAARHVDLGRVAGGVGGQIVRTTDSLFVLMVESGRIDKYSHSLDWERSVYDTVMLDNAVKLAKEFASRRDDTLVIVVADHAHPTAIISTYDDDCPGRQLRDKLGVYPSSLFDRTSRAALTSWVGSGWSGYFATVPFFRKKRSSTVDVGGVEQAEQPAGALGGLELRLRGDIPVAGVREPGDVISDLLT
jgi:hypothetical protein